MARTLLVSGIFVPTDLKTEQDANGDRYWVDGLRVTGNLYTFCITLRKHHAFKACLFGTHYEADAGDIHKDLWVYAPDEIFCRGKVGYGDVGVVAYITKYYVESEQICNNKVHCSRRQFNMTSSDNVDRMVVAAKRYLRPYPLTKIVDLTAYKLTTSLSQEKDSTSDEEAAAMNVMKEMLTRNGALTAELANMVKVDYKFKDNAVHDAITAYMDTIDNDIEVSARNIAIALVLVHPPHSDGAEHVITVQRGKKHLNLRNRVFVSDVERSFEDAPIERYTPSTLPDEIRQKISSLNILDVNSYVNGLGLRQSENIYYLAEDA